MVVFYDRYGMPVYRHLVPVWSYISKLNSLPIWVTVYGDVGVRAHRKTSLSSFVSNAPKELIIAVATPLDLQNVDAFVAWSFEAAYNLPTNQTNFTYPPILSRAFDFISRKSLYEVVETRIAKFGYEGKQCLLRAICEATAYTFEHNGVLGDLLHLVLRPSSSENEQLPSDYTEAERIGEESANCTKYTERCPTSILDLIVVPDDNSDTTVLEDKSNTTVTNEISDTVTDTTPG